MLLEMNVKLRPGHFDLTTQLSVGDISVGLFGQSGAGKSTLLSLIAGTLQPQSGHILVDGKILFDSRKGIFMPRELRINLKAGSARSFPAARACWCKSITAAPYWWKSRWALVKAWPYEKAMWCIV